MIAALLRPHIFRIGLALALAAALWLIRQDGAAQAKREAAAQALATESRLRAELRVSERRLAERLAGIDAALDEHARGIAGTGAAILPIIRKELNREPRYHDPAAGISDELRAAIDRARAAVACTPAVDGGIVCALPAAEAAPGQ